MNILKKGLMTCVFILLAFLMMPERAEASDIVAPDAFENVDTGTDAKYITSEYRDEYRITLEKNGLLDVGDQTNYNIMNALFFFIRKLAYLTCCVFYFCMTFNVNKLFGDSINTIQETLRAEVFRPFFVVAFVGVAIMMARHLLKRNSIGVFTEIIKVVFIVALSILVFLKSDVALEYSISLTKTISLTILGAVDEDLDMGGDSKFVSKLGLAEAQSKKVEKYAAQAAGILYANLVHYPWKSMQFGDYANNPLIANNAVADLYLSNAYLKPSAKNDNFAFMLWNSAIGILGSGNEAAWNDTILKELENEGLTDIPEDPSEMAVGERVRFLINMMGADTLKSGKGNRYATAIDYMNTSTFADARMDFEASERAVDIIGYELCYLIPFVTKCALFMFMSLAQLVCQVAMLFFLLAAPIVLLLAMMPQYGFDLIGKWISKMFETCLSVIAMTFILAIIMWIDKALFSLQDQYGWMLITWVQVACSIGIIIFRKQLLSMFLGVSQKMTNVVTRPNDIRTTISRTRTPGELTASGVDTVEYGAKRTVSAVAGVTRSVAYGAAAAGGEPQQYYTPSQSQEQAPEQPRPSLKSTQTENTASTAQKSQYEAPTSSSTSTSAELNHSYYTPEEPSYPEPIKLNGINISDEEKAEM